MRVPLPYSVHLFRVDKNLTFFLRVSPSLWTWWMCWALSAAVTERERRTWYAWCTSRNKNWSRIYLWTAATAAAAAPTVFANEKYNVRLNLSWIVQVPAHCCTWTHFSFSLLPFQTIFLSVSFSRLCCCCAIFKNENTFRMQFETFRRMPGAMRRSVHSAIHGIFAMAKRKKWLHAIGNWHKRVQWDHFTTVAAIAISSPLARSTTSTTLLYSNSWRGSARNYLSTISLSSLHRSRVCSLTFFFCFFWFITLIASMHTSDRTTDTHRHCLGLCLLLSSLASTHIHA